MSGAVVSSSPDHAETGASAGASAGAVDRCRRPVRSAGNRPARHRAGGNDDTRRMKADDRRGARKKRPPSVQSPRRLFASRCSKYTRTHARP